MNCRFSGEKMTSDRLMFFPSKGKIFSRLKQKSTNHVPKTVVIFGSTRGGTTMTARVVSSFGINLGDDLGVNCEDSAFYGIKISQTVFELWPNVGSNSLHETSKLFEQITNVMR